MHYANRHHPADRHTDMQTHLYYSAAHELSIKRKSTNLQSRELPKQDSQKIIQQAVHFLPPSYIKHSKQPGEFGLLAAAYYVEGVTSGVWLNRDPTLTYRITRKITNPLGRLSELTLSTTGDSAKNAEQCVYEHGKIFNGIFPKTTIWVVGALLVLEKIEKNKVCGTGLYSGCVALRFVRQPSYADDAGGSNKKIKVPPPPSPLRPPLPRWPLYC